MDTQELLPEIYNLASVLYRVKQERSVGLLHIMLNVLMKLTSVSRVNIRSEVASLSLFPCENKRQKPLIDVHSNEAEFFCDLVATVQSPVISATFSLQDVLKTLISTHFPQLPPQLQLKFLLISEQCRLKNSPVDQIFILAEKLTPCELIRFIYKSIKFSFLGDLNAPVWTKCEKYMKILPIYVRNENYVAKTTEISRFLKEIPSYLSTSKLIFRAEKLISGFNSHFKPSKKLKFSLSRLLILLVFTLNRIKTPEFSFFFKSLYTGLEGKFDIYMVKSAAIRLKALQALQLIAESEQDLSSALKCELLLGEKPLFESFLGYFRQTKSEKEECLVLFAAWKYAKSRENCGEEFRRRVEREMPTLAGLMKALETRIG